MTEQPVRMSFRSFWSKLVAFVLVIAAAYYASQHPHTFAYYLIKFFLVP